MTNQGMYHSPVELNVLLITLLASNWWFAAIHCNAREGQAETSTSLNIVKFRNYRKVPTRSNNVLIGKGDI